jgi:HlyD family secretion protein
LSPILRGASIFAGSPGGKQFRVSAGMLVSAEVNLGSRTVMEYLLSPVQKVTHEAGREM